MAEKSDVCPKCGSPIVRPEKSGGMWDGRKVDGTKAGGGIFRTVCGNCNRPLTAYVDILENEFRWQVDWRKRDSN
jgi:ribosomal protein L37AE/L43A